MGSNVDVITLSVVQGEYFAVTKEMTITMERTGRSAVFTLMHDYSNAIFDGVPGNPRMICQGDDLPAHLGSIFIGHKKMAQFWGNDINPGDIMLCNDPAWGGAHLQDFCMYKPIFYKDELMFWAVTKGHFSDVGGPTPGGYHPTAKDMYAEGLRIPPIKLWEKGKLRQDILDMIVSNIRDPEARAGDLRALLAATRVGEEGLRNLVAKYGVDTIKACNDELLNSREREIRAMIKEWPNGTYEGGTVLEDQGFEWGELEIRIKIEVKDDEIIVSVRGPKQVEHFVNSYWANTHSYIYAGILFHTGLRGPFNEGMYRPIKVDLGPPGTIVNATTPAPCSNSTTTIGYSLIEAVLDVIQKIAPEKVVTISGHRQTTAFEGLDPKTNKRYSQLLTVGSGFAGGGAAYGHDGRDCMSSGGGGKISYGDLELHEYKMPFIIHRHEYVTDSGCAGKWRGGLSVEVEIEPIGHEMKVINSGDGVVNLPLSTGGAQGKSRLIEPKLGYRRRVKDGKVQEVIKYQKAEVLVSRGERWVARNSGGGGVGLPFERDPENVREDVINGYVSIKGARLDYGVVIYPETYEIDLEATQQLRGKEQEDVSSGA